MTDRTDRGPPTAPAPGSPEELTPPHAAAVRVRAAIERAGPITFAAFMEIALYEPTDGFYATPPVGEGGDFVTSPHVSPAFGSLLALQVAEMWELLGRPDPFHVLEAGAGDGTLARQIVRSFEPDLAGASAYLAIDRSAGARAALVALSRSLKDDDEGATPVPDLQVAADLPSEPVGAGVILANELLDNLPFHRLRGTAGGIAELYVDAREDVDRGFVLREGPPSMPQLSAIAPALAPGEEWVVSIEARRFVERASAALTAGYLLVFDYAARPLAGGRGSPAVHAYRGHRVLSDVLSDPGTRDITVGVDMDGLAGHARSLGLRTWGPVSQRDALFAIGFRAWDGWARSQQVEAADAGRGAEATRVYAARSRASLLVDPTGLGGFAVLCIGVGDVPPPIAVRDTA